MLRKYAAAQVIAVAPADRLRSLAHRAVFNFVPRPGYLYVRSRSISSRCNDNYDYFGPDEIAKSYESFNGKPVFVNHNNHDHRRARGMVIATVLHRDRNPDGSPDTWAETLMEVDAKSYPRLAKAILDGDIDRTSMGCDVELSKCSVCGNEATSPLEYCSHIPGQKGKRIYRMGSAGQREGVLVYEICSGLRFFENSLLVEPPADPTAYFLGEPVMGPGLEHLHAKAASLQAVLAERPAEPPMAKRPQPVSPTYAPMQHTAAAGDDWSTGMDPERRRKAEELGGKLWEGINQAFDPGSTPDSRKSDRNSRVMNALQNNGYQPHHIKFDEDDDDHPYAHVEGNRGWYAIDHSGPHLEIRHHGTGNESHDLINLQHYDRETRSQYRAPGYGPAEAHQDLHHWTDGDPEETGGAAGYLEQHDPRIKRWQQRHQASLQVEAYKPEKPVKEMNEQEYAVHQTKVAAAKKEGEAWNRKNPVRIKHIVDHWDNATDDEKAQGMRWYSDAHELSKHVANDTGTGMHTMAGLLSNYSPQTHWATNIMNAARVARTKIAQGGKGSGIMATTRQKGAAQRLLDGEHYDKVLAGPKTRAFAHLIHHGGNADDENPHVVIDRHALSVATGARATDNAYAYSKLGNKGRYNEVSQAYHKAAKKISKQVGYKVHAHQVQAATWLARQRLNEDHDSKLTTTATSRSAQNARGAIREWNSYAAEHHPGAIGLEPGVGYASAPDDVKHVSEMKNEGLTVPKAASLHMAYGETIAPQDVDTLRDERCAICGNDTAYDGRECLVCGYLAPPKALGDPDVDKAKRLDELKQSVDDALLDVDPSRQGAEFDPGDTDAIQAEEGEVGAPSALACPQCGTEFPSAPPTTEDTEPGMEQEGPAEGDVCPACGQGVLEATGEPEDVGGAEEGELEPGEDSQDEAQDDAEGGLPGEQDPDDPDGADEAEDPDADAEEQPDDDDEDEDDVVADAKKKKRPVPGRAATSKYQRTPKGIEMQKALAALAELQALVEYQQHENRKLATRLAAKDSQIQRLTYGLQAIAQHLGPDVDTLVRSAMLHKRADEQNPAQPIPEPAPEPAVDGTVRAETPEATADINQPGMVPGSTQDVAADAVSTAYTPGQDIGASPVKNLVDVTRPVDGTQGPRPLSETKTNVDVRVGNPMNPQVAFPLGGPFSAPQRTGSLQAPAEEGGDVKAMASIRLARLRIATGEEGDDLAMGQKIASEMAIGEINAEINTLNSVLKRTAARNSAQQAPPRGAVPRPAAGVQRTVPSLGATASRRTTAARDDDADLALIFLGEDALSS